MPFRIDFQNGHSAHSTSVSHSVRNLLSSIPWKCLLRHSRHDDSRDNTREPTPSFRRKFKLRVNLREGGSKAKHSRVNRINIQLFTHITPLRMHPAGSMDYCIVLLLFFLSVPYQNHLRVLQVRSISPQRE